MHCYDVIIIGAGPAGLAGAIAARKAGLDFRVLEKGVLVNSLFNFPSQMVFFTTPELLEIGGLPFVSARDKPTRDETLRYYRRVVDTYELDIDFGLTLTGLDFNSKDSNASYTIQARDGAGTNSQYKTRTVVLATGTYDRPNLLGIPGENLSHVSHYYTEPHAFYRKKVIIVGGKNSAAEAALDLYRAGVDVTLVHRGATLGSSIKYWVKPDIENRIKEGSIQALFNTEVVEIRSGEVVTQTVSDNLDSSVRKLLPADAVFLLTGYLADVSLLRACGVEVDKNTNIPVRDKNTFETNRPGLYLAGSVVAGANRGEVFIENGRFHGRIVVEDIAKKKKNSKD
tara:strand:+ start:8889 stop:9911 length:1023 start_codon:yes stop_codon:yes gene_type:complete